MADILIVDDEIEIARLMADEFRDMGQRADIATTIRGCREKIAGRPYDVVFLDVRLPDGNGLEIIGEIAAGPSNPEVIIMTGYGDPNGAELAIRNGAWDYIEKPASLSDFTLPLVRAIQYREAQRQCQVRGRLKRESIIGTSPAVERCLNLVARAAAMDVNVLITGESGTGKELFARAIHDNSGRSDGAFVVVDCASLPVSIIEGVLFGHEKGAFTGADQARQGLIQQADGGTLFLDELGELPLKIQKAFLRVLQEGTFRPLGGKRELRSHFRLVAATNCNLEERVRKGLFRGDLLYRVRSVTIDLPPLRERREDINTLIFHYLRVLCERYQMDVKGFSPEFMEAMGQYSWPGNVRELVHTLESIVAIAGPHPIIYPKHLPAELRVKLLKQRISPKEAAPPAEEGSGRLPDIAASRQAADRRYLEALIVRTRGDIREMVRVSGLSRAQIYSLLKSHGLNRRASP
ncbi:MAG: sigma-54 dependent transcriptional regulator [Deltaproteobacteria bacterium]|nr:sigma-54 dependent transcriptional regulator [Deltaproteobacteria bacterium]